MANFLICLVILCPSTIFASLVTISERPANGRLEALERSTMKLTCLVPDSQILNRLYWNVPGKPEAITNTDMINSPYIQVERTIPPKVMLFVRYFSSFNQGIYSCRLYDRSDATNRRLVAEVNVTVSLVSDISVQNAEPEQWLQLGSKNSIVFCQVVGNPAPVVQWLRNSKIIRTNAKYTQETNGLRISNVEWSDGGKYVCRASRGDTAEARDIFIEVKVFQKPQIIQGPTLVFPSALTEGRDAWIDCKAKGNPPPKYFWMKKQGSGKELQKVDPQRYFVNQNTGRLRIFRVDVQKDTDIFTCIAALTSRAIRQDIENMKAEASRKFEAFSWPRFVDTALPLNPWVNLGRPITLTCTVLSNQPVQMQFQKYEAEFPYVTGGIQDDPRITVTQRTEPSRPLYHFLDLKISSTKTEDTSNYTCIVTNLAANVSINGTIRVRHKPIMANNKEVIIRGWLRNSTNLTCTAYGMPFPRWTWFRHDLIHIKNTNRTFHVFSYDFDRYSKSWLQIRPDFGEMFAFDTYRCMAENDEGTGNSTLNFMKADPPGPPKVSDVKVTSSSVSFRVYPPESDGGMPVLYYLVNYRAQASGRSSWYGPVEFPGNYTLTLQGLVSDTDYIFEVRARNIVGRSQIPTILQPRTKALSVPSKVQVLSPPLSTYPYTFFLRWKVPNNGGEPISGYNIHVRRRGAAGDWRLFRPLFDNPNLSEYFIVDLEANSKYELNIQAFNEKGSSPDSIFYFRTPMADLKGKPDRVRGEAYRHLPHPLLLLCVLLMFFATPY